MSDTIVIDGEVELLNVIDGDPGVAIGTGIPDGSLTEVKFSDALKLKTIKDYVTPEMYGAKGDGVTDDTAAVQAAFDYVSSHDSSTYLLVKGKYRITSQITVSGTGLFRVQGIDVNTSVIICDGSNACLKFFDSNSVQHEIDLRDVQIRGDYTQTVPLLSFKNVHNIYLNRVYTVNAGANNYGMSFDKSGIITCEGCLIVGSNDVASYPAYSNGVYVYNCSSIFTFKGANIWNLQTVFVFEGNAGQINIEANWIECVMSLIERNIKSGENGRYTAFNIVQNVINVHSYAAFVPNVINFVKVAPAEANAQWYDSQVNFSHNTVYIATSENITVNGNSLVYFTQGVTSGGIFNIYFDGNIFSGKTLADIGCYVFKSSVTVLYTDCVRIRSAKIAQRTDASYITDDVKILSDTIPILNSTRSGISAPAGVYLNNGNTLNDGRLLYDNNTFYAYIGGSAYTLFNSNTKLVKTKTMSATTGATGNIALGTSSSSEKVIAIIGDVNGIYTPFISNGNNFVHVTTRAGADIAETDVTITIIYV